MDKIYNLDNGNKIAIYSVGSEIVINTLPLIPRSRPMAICNDYAGMLHSCIHAGTLYYVYKNLSNNLALGSLPTGQSQIILNDEALLFNPNICDLISGGPHSLVMPAILNNPLNNTFSVNLFVLINKSKRIILADNLDYQPTVNSFFHNGTLYVFINPPDNSSLKKVRIFQIEMQTKSETTEYSVCEIPAVISIDKPCDNCKMLEKKIESITIQYNQLAETARKIQEEGRQWKRLYEESI